MIGHAVVRALLVLGTEEQRAVILNADDVGMRVFQLDKGRVRAAEQLDDQVQRRIVMQDVERAEVLV